MEPLAKVFGRRLRKLREAKGLTQEQLGDAAGVNFKHVGAVERGDSVPSFEAVEKLATELGADYYELFLPESMEGPEPDQGLKVLIREIEKNGSPQLKHFLRGVLASALDQFANPRNS